jgi:hypothetical protein
MRTFVLTLIYMVSTGIIFAVPAVIIGIIFPCTYTDVVNNPYYGLIMVITSLIISGYVIDEIHEKN